MHVNQILPVRVGGPGPAPGNGSSSWASLQSLHPCRPGELAEGITKAKACRVLPSAIGARALARAGAVDEREDAREPRACREPGLRHALCPLLCDRGP